ncbi:Putative ribonuclease H protein At1g65750 [Linum perenne]
MVRGARSSIRDGRGTRFWTANWVDSGVRLIDLIEDGGAAPDLESLVADFVDLDGQWDVVKLLQVLPPDAVDLVVGITPPRADRGDDMWVWGGEENGRFSIKSAYKLICNQHVTQRLDPWKSIWRWKGPNRTRYFLWLAVQEKLLTNSSRVRRQMTDTGTCSFCSAAEETSLHVIRDCQFAVDVWRLLGIFDTSDSKWQSPISEWMCHFLNSENGTTFGNICWFLWKSRNGRIFADDRTKPAGVVARGLSWSSSVTDALRKTKSVLGEGSSRFELNLAWDPGPADWVTLNTDGSVDCGRRKASAGGLLRDSEGRCILAFTMNLGTCSITRAEMRGAIEGLKRTWEAGFRRVML